MKNKINKITNDTKEKKLKEPRIEEKNKNIEVEKTEQSTTQILNKNNNFNITNNNILKKEHSVYNKDKLQNNNSDNKSVKLSKRNVNLVEYNIACFKEVLRIAQGTRTMTEYLAQCGVHTTLLKILKSDKTYLNLSDVVFKESLLKALAEKADNNVTYEEFALSLKGFVYKGRNFNQRPQPDKIIKFVKKAMGKNSISSFSSQIDVSRRVISLMLQEKINTVTPKIIEKIGSQLSNEDKEELYDAFGYPTMNNSFMSKEDKDIVSFYTKNILRKKKHVTTNLCYNKNSSEGPSKEFLKISDMRWDIFKKDIFNKFFKYYNYQQVNNIVPMSQEDYWDLREDDRTQIKMSYRKYKTYMIKLTSLPLCKQTPMELLSYLRMDDETTSPQWKYANYLDIIFVNESSANIAEKTGLSINTVNAFKKQISNRSIKRLSIVYKHISEQELLKYASDAGVLLFYEQKGCNAKKALKARMSK